jgi:hypothetical protein
MLWFLYRLHKNHDNMIRRLPKNWRGPLPSMFSALAGYIGWRKWAGVVVYSLYSASFEHVSAQFIAPLAHTLFCVYIRMTEGGFEIPFSLCKDSEMDRQTREKYIMERVHEWKLSVDSLDFLLSYSSYSSLLCLILILKSSHFYTVCCDASKRLRKRVRIFHFTLQRLVVSSPSFSFSKTVHFVFCLIHRLDFSSVFTKAQKCPTSLTCPDLDGSLMLLSSGSFSYSLFPRCLSWEFVLVVNGETWLGRPLRYYALNLTFCRGPSFLVFGFFFKAPFIGLLRSSHFFAIVNVDERSSLTVV